jgi:hypothetical protein
MPSIQAWPYMQNFLLQFFWLRPLITERLHFLAYDSNYIYEHILLTKCADNLIKKLISKSDINACSLLRPMCSTAGLSA